MSAELAQAGVAARTAVGDPTLWPALARPGWVHALRTARPLVGEIAALHEARRVAGQIRVLLATTGGVGVAAEALTAADPRLVVLDGTDPVAVADALAGELSATVLVTSVPPGEDPAPVAVLRDTVHAAFRAEGLDPAAHTVAVVPAAGAAPPTDGTVVVAGPDDVDGLWAAFTAYVLVPVGLVGTDVGAVLADATAVRAGLAEDSPDNPALVLGALLADVPAVAIAAGTDIDPDTGTVLAEGAEQLVAGGLGKDGRGPLPLRVEGATAPEWATLPGVGIGDVPGALVSVRGTPAAQLLTWQHAVAVAAHLLALDPTDRPDARPAPGSAGGSTGFDAPAFVDGAVAVSAGDWLPAGTATVGDALRALVDLPGPAETGIGHLAVHAYLDRVEDASAAVLRPELARRVGMPTTFGWAPRCLPGAAQHTTGGPSGVRVCQLTGEFDDGTFDREFGAADEASGNGTGDDPLADAQRAQADAEAAALTAHGRPVLRLHFIDRVAGLVTVAHAVQQLHRTWEDTNPGVRAETQ